jgi:metal-dependent hydrolase (beta-lactamase superfamily II)
MFKKKNKKVIVVVGDLHMEGFKNILEAKAPVKNEEEIKPVVNEHCQIRRKRREMERRITKIRLKIM